MHPPGLSVLKFYIICSPLHNIVPIVNIFRSVNYSSEHRMKLSLFHKIFYKLPPITNVHVIFRSEADNDQLQKF